MSDCKPRESVRAFSRFPCHASLEHTLRAMTLVGDSLVLAMRYKDTIQSLSAYNNPVYLPPSSPPQSHLGKLSPLPPSLGKTPLNHLPTSLTSLSFDACAKPGYERNWVLVRLSRVEGSR